MTAFYSLNEQSKRSVNAISSRLSLRQPQRDSLEILAHILEKNPPVKGGDLVAELAKVQEAYPNVASFDREFVSLCFALATGVGKTRLMGAFMALLYTQYGVRNFFVLAPNLTIYNKLITDFSPASPKYVLNGLQEFANNPPLVITGDNYDSGIDVGSGRLNQDEVTINVFNVAKISSEVRGGKAPRIKRLSEYIGQSYFEYLASLEDLVMIMDESHRYRASAGFKAINELKPMLGLELTATPQIESSTTPERFKNVIYDYPLANAIADGFVKEPAVATREDFNADNYGEEELEDLKIRDGVVVHEDTKIELATFARNHNLPIVKPFMLVVAKDTTHADNIVERIKRDDFFGGRYKDKVITVHSNQKGTESDETIARLLAVEDPTEPTEIVVHVDKLKEGWDVRNLYTIVPLRAANSSTLVEQSIGRGLRLPYGKRMGVAAVDRLTIVAHDKFDAIINEANKPGSIIRAVVRIGKDINLVGKKAVTVTNTAIEQLIGRPTVQPVPSQQFDLGVQAKPALTTREEQTVVNLIVEAIKENERRVTDVPNLEALIKPDVQARIAKKVTEAYETTYQPAQAEFAETSTMPDIAAIVKDSLKRYLDLNIGIPRISVRPKGTVRTGFKDFELDTSAVNQQPVDQNILIQHLRTSDRSKIHADLAYATEERFEDYIVRNLVDFDDISYDEHADILYKLSSQVVAKLRSYLSADAEVLNVIQFNQRQFATYIHSQMQAHWWQEADEGYEVTVSRGYQTFTDTSYSADGNEKLRNVHQPLATGERDRIGGMLFGGFERCSYPVQKFSSDSERMFASLLEKDLDAMKWFKPTRDQFAISYRDASGSTATYEPDFVVETATHKYIVEPKQASLINDVNVQAKKQAAVTWCENASKHELSNGGKEWSYVLVPHTAILPSATLIGLVKQFGA
ncbi:DEAD/DEAH box helicase family protein [Polynucleobacter sp. MWH-P3-07-1]|uniref:DEAD/DEAH box helicase n=1 Tax=Polynucleobacter sp. MWH-P3-07-1 TaxID=1743173 RepID=UPI001BFEE642|nr:DEAD/DEAH box helicase family protein [Polynucleobacter sp. MWH-P3-07-1]QWD84113.1 DEAD/DEAH box helicase family protein [Polynucleobacter sp. MWH-P3-07-1]